MSGVITSTPTPPTPTREQILLRDRWLRSLAPEERDTLDELPLREVDRRFDAWREGLVAGGGAGRG
jgi:hypothetical protein